MSDGKRKAQKSAERPVSNRSLDDIDRKILNILQNDANRPVNEIAESVNLSPTPCWRRIRRLEDIGIISKRVALVNRRLVNMPMIIFIAVKAPRHETSWLDAFRKLIEEIPEVVESYRLTGDIDYLIKVVVPDIDTYDLVYKRMIDKVSFSQFSSFISMEEMKFTTAIPTKYS